ncbi:MAG: 5'-methylthioadenosine/S-adenosylhomocysteine nucleosidase [Candidatus Cloacimonetes bacterium]|nr:5'-methylthioadenosine/S-adenosylhomocysteine nucleosidase [Candidatus Cloacimonadota bacterium]
MRIIILIAADAEWKATKEILDVKERVSISPYGEWFKTKLHGMIEGVIFQTGCGKVASAGATQHAIDKWRPDLIINLGTCGGIKGQIKQGQIILVNKTIIYDIIEEEGQTTETKDRYITDIEIDWIMPYLPKSVMPFTMLTADRDLISNEIDTLIEKYNARVVDWESGSIAYIARRNNIKCLIIRGVSDLVSKTEHQIYGNDKLFEQLALRTMKKLFQLLTEIITDISRL